jgi:hypothetical protein
MHLSACSDRCGWCGRCDDRSRRDRVAPFSRNDFLAIQAGFRAHGLRSDYFDFDDIEYLRKQGKDVADVIAAAVEHQDRERRLAPKGA